jgi:hypothetical protein
VPQAPQTKKMVNYKFQHRMNYRLSHLMLSIMNRNAQAGDYLNAARTGKNVVSNIYPAIPIAMTAKQVSNNFRRLGFLPP